MPTYQGGGRPRQSLHGGVGRRVLQFMAGASGISPYLRVGDGSFSLGVHRQPEPTSFTVLASDMLYICTSSSDRYILVLHICELDYSRCNWIIILILLLHMNLII